MSDLDDLENLLIMRIFDCHETDTCSLLKEHYGVSDIVIMETANELAKAILWRYSIQPKISTHCPGSDDPRCKNQCTLDCSTDPPVIRDPDCFR